MSNPSKGKVIPFPTVEHSFITEEEYQAEKESGRAARIIEAGGQALDNLKSWRCAIPVNDRTQMALNMELDILNRYKLKVREIIPFTWNDYPSDGAFRRDLHRARIKNSTISSHKRLIAGTAGWIKILICIHAALDKKRMGISLEALAGKMTNGTRFHPLNKTAGLGGKLRYLIKDVANKVTESKGLLEAYRSLARARAEYLNRYGHELGYPDTPLDFNIDINECLGDTFELLEGYESLFTRRFIDYSTTDWDALFEIIPDDYKYNYEMKKSSFIDRQRLFEAETTLVGIDTSGFGPTLWHEEDLFYLPRFYIGYHLWDVRSRDIPRTAEHFEMLKNEELPGLFRPKDDDLSYLRSDKEKSVPEIHHGACYLVLYPDTNLNSIIPYIFRYAEEGSQFTPYEDDPYDGDFFAYQIINGEDLRGYTLMDRIEDNKEEFLSSLLDTSSSIKHHPYLQWESNRSKSIDDFLHDMNIHSEDRIRE